MASSNLPVSRREPLLKAWIGAEIPDLDLVPKENVHDENDELALGMFNDFAQALGELLPPLHSMGISMKLPLCWLTSHLVRKG